MLETVIPPFPLNIQCIVDPIESLEEGDVVYLKGDRYPKDTFRPNEPWTVCTMIFPPINPEGAVILQSRWTNIKGMFEYQDLLLEPEEPC